ncbi:MAG: NADP-dependent oxidoreductase [Chitinophagaceae bacterium]
MPTNQIVLASRPKGKPILENFETESIELPELKEGELLLEPMFYSVDPYMRGRMNDAKSYAPPFEVGKPIKGGVIAKVIKTNSFRFKINDIVTGNLPWQQQIISTETGLLKIDTTIAPASYYLGILGMPGLTAYFGLLHIGKPKAGETVVVSGAAGAVGILVGQIAKLQGCRVIGIAGSDEKIKSLKEEFGYDEGINYKTNTDIKKTIAEACPNGVDIYFDNTGGEISDAVISNINFHARIVLCGQIALYNSTEIPIGPRLQHMLLTRSVLMQGFIVSNYQNQFPEGLKNLSLWLTEGKLKYKETIIKGFDKLPSALLGLFSGDNMGKMIVEA